MINESSILGRYYAVLHLQGIPIVPIDVNASIYPLGSVYTIHVYCVGIIVYVEGCFSLYTLHSTYILIGIKIEYNKL